MRPTTAAFAAALALGAALGAAVPAAAGGYGWRHLPQPAWHTYRGDCLPRYGFYDRPEHYWIPVRCWRERLTGIESCPVIGRRYYPAYYPGWRRTFW